MTLGESNLHCQSNECSTIYSISSHEYPNVILSSGNYESRIWSQHYLLKSKLLSIFRSSLHCTSTDLLNRKTSFSM